jgi:ribose transport system permease protein
MSGVRHWMGKRSYVFAAGFAAALLVANVIAQSSFVDPSTWASTLSSFAPLAIIAMANTPSILSGGGGLDISVAPLMSLINIFFVVELLPHGLGSVAVSLPIMLLMGILVGALNGVLVTVLRYQPVIATLCIAFVLLGVNLAITAAPVGARANWTDQLANSIGPIPGALFTIGAPVVVWAILRRSSYTDALYAVGGDDVAAYSAGVRVTWVRIVAYALGGLFAAVGGIALTALISSADPTFGLEFAIIGITSVALGGTSLWGGRGGITGSILGAATIFLLQNLLAALSIATVYLEIAYSAALLFAVLLSANVATGGKREEALG